MSDIKLYNGDCLEVMDNLIEQGVKVDLTVTSPPYDNLRSYNGNNDLWNESVWKKVIEKLYKITSDGRIVVWVVGDATVKGSETGTSFKQALYFKECGFNLHDTMIYQKNSYPFPPSNRYYQQFEYMFIFSKGTPNTSNLIRVEAQGRKRKSTTRNQDGSTSTTKYETGHKTRIADNVWFIDTGYMRTTKDKFAYKHPAMFPEKLANDHIISWSNDNDIVFDPFLGSGTTGKMAILNNRKFIGIELDENYFKIAEDRIHKALIEKENI